MIATAATDLELVGIHEHLPAALYHNPPGISFTGFKKFMRSPKKYQAYIDRPQLSTQSQIKGQLVHCMALEPEEVSKRFAWIKGPMNRNPFMAQAKEAKEAGLIPVGQTDWEEAVGMSTEILNHPQAGTLIRNGAKELSGYFQDPVTGVLRKFRPDIWWREKAIIGDIKYVDDAGEDFFLMMLRKNLWHIQSDWYLEGATILTGIPHRAFVHICVEEGYPHEVQCHALNDASLERARMTIQHHLQKFAWCMQRDEWPGLPAGVHELAIPDWMWGRLEEETV